MGQEILSLAIFELVAGDESEALATLGKLSDLLAAKGYSHDSLHRDSKSAAYVLIRRWTSDDTRRAALEDPEILRCWAKLGHMIRPSLVYEKLDEAGQ
jgi:hypothetical protein